MNEDNQPTARSVGLRESLLDGWCNLDTGELTKGVPIRPSDTVVDIGCGDGRLVGFCAQRGADVVFIDTNSKKVAATEGRLNRSAANSYRGIVSDCDPIPLEDYTGDIVICTEVLEHVREPAALLAEIVRIAKPGAVLVITVPDSRSEVFLGATAPVACFQEPNHIQIFTADEFKSLIIAAGLQIESHEFKGCFWSMYWPLSWMTCEPFGEGLPIDNPHPITVHWTELWHEIQQHPHGDKIREGLNSLMPKSQCIVARKVM